VFKLIFRTITLLVFLVFLCIGLAIWKGGEPFRWIGDKLITAGRTINDFGNFIDDIIAGGKTLQKNYKQIKEIIDQEHRRGD